MAKRCYVVTDTSDLTTRLVNASSQAQAIAHVVKGRYLATPADVADILARASDGKVNVETAGEAAE